jgi:tape measure domain-containing protein
MALQGSIVITAKVDSGDASKQLQELIGRIEALEGEQAKAARAAADHADKLERLRGVSQAAAGTMAVVAAGLAAAGIASVKLAADLEQSRVAFTTLLGSAEKADAFLKDLAKFAASTPFEFVGLQDSARRLLAFGFAAQDIIPLMNSIGSAVAGLGGGKEQIDRVTLALGQMQAKGKVSAEELNQLAELGIPAWKMISDAIGISIPEAMKRAEKGAIDSNTAINALINGMNEKFPGMLEKQSKTINGVFSNLIDGATRTATLIGERLIRAFHVADIIGNAANIIAGFAATIENAGLVAAMDKLFPPGLQVTIVAIAGALTASMIPALAGVATAFGTAVVAAGPFLLAGAAVGGLAYTIARNWEGLTTFFSGLFSGISTLVGKLVENIRKPFTAVINWIREKLRTLLEIVSGVLERIGAFVPAPIKQALGNALTFLQNKADDVKDAIGGAVQGVITLGGKAVTAASSGIRALSGLITPEVQALIDAGKAGGVSTAFKGLSGTKPAAAGGPTAAEVKKAQKDAEHRKKIIADYVAWQAEQDRDADERSRKLTSEYIAWQAKQDRDDDKRRKNLKTDYIAWQAKQDQEAAKNAAAQLNDALSMASQLFAGNFGAVASTIGGKLKDQIVQALAQSPDVRSAIDGLSSALTGPLGIAAMFGLMMYEGVVNAGKEAERISKEVKDNAEKIDKLVNPEKYANRNPRFDELQRETKAAEERARKAEQAVFDFQRSPAYSLSFGLIGGAELRALQEAAKKARDQANLIFQEMAKTPKDMPIDATLIPIGGGRAVVPNMQGPNLFDLRNQALAMLGIKPEEKPAAMPGETPEKPIYTQVVNVRDFREAFPDSAYFRAPSVDTTRSLNANAVTYR